MPFEIPISFVVKVWAACAKAMFINPITDPLLTKGAIRSDFILKVSVNSFGRNLESGTSSIIIEPLVSNILSAIMSVSGFIISLLKYAINESSVRLVSAERKAPSLSLQRWVQQKSQLISHGIIPPIRFNN